MKNHIAYLTAILMLNLGCSKTDFLNEKPQKSLLIPSTLEDFQAILDDDVTMNGTLTAGVSPQLGESGSDNFYLFDADYNTFLRPQMQNYYIWSEHPYDGINVTDWELPYTAILYANAVIEGIKGIERTEHNKGTYDNVVGQALFHRTYMFHQLAQVFAPAYNPDSDNDELGIILRLEADINETLTRATVRETYDRITNDLSHCITLLNDTPAHKCRPSKQAAYGLMARTYLSMKRYDLAGLYADSCLQIQNDLFDFNLANASVQSPFQGNPFDHPVNSEVIFFTAMLSNPSQNFPTTPNYARVDSNLYVSYHQDDLRKSVFFDPLPPVGHRFKGTYSFRGFPHYFSGLAVDEMLLIRAECNARSGDVTQALQDLNTLLLARWNNNAIYEPYEGLDTEETLSIILEERRKELLFRGLRWSDLRRLNQEGYGITLERNIDGQVHRLLPNDPRWTWPLPVEVIAQ